MNAASMPDVIVIGAGPVGLALALYLVRANLRVQVLEKEAGTAEHSRAAALWPGAQAVLARLDVLDSVRTHGNLLSQITLHNADAAGDKPLLRLPMQELARITPYPELVVIPQSTTEWLLCEAVTSHVRAEVRFDTEVTAIEQDNDSVRVSCRQREERSTLRAPFAVGCDGAGSSVREQLGFAFRGETYPAQAALADLRTSRALDLQFPRLTTRAGLALAIRLRPRLWRLVLPFTADSGRPLDRRVREAAAALLATSAFETVWQSEFRLHRRIAERFVQGRIALAGDAAHLNSPVGGQGMNAGLLDTPLLGDSLLRALHENRPASLSDYDTRRRAAIEQGVNRFTDTLTRALLLGNGALIKPGLRTVQAALLVPALRHRLLRRLAMLDGDDR